MLAEHLTQDHNHASRRFETIDREVRWIHEELLGGTPTPILDLTCGPGLYTSRLARLGHKCVGIDYAPESLRYAEETASNAGLACTYRFEDVRTADYGHGYGMAMMISGQFNVFRRSDARAILEKAFSALLPDGLLLLEPQRFDSIGKNGRAGTSWYSCGEGGGLFSDRPHLCLIESFWDSERQAATERFFIIDAETAEVTRHALTNEAYTDEQFRELLTEVGFGDIRFFPSLVGVDVEDEAQSDNLVVVGRKMPSRAL
jgi:SAM-dependent methyltransferase